MIPKVSGSKVNSIINMANSTFPKVPYTTVFAQAFAPPFFNFTKSLMYPLGVTNMAHATYITVGISSFHYSSEALYVVDQVSD